MSKHAVVVVNRPEDDGVECTILCSDPAACDGWVECLEKGHDDEPDDTDEEREFHGVVHEYHWGYGWTVPFEGCPVIDHDHDFDAFQHLPSGTYDVETEWDDTDLYLHLPHDPKPHLMEVMMKVLECNVIDHPRRGQRWCMTHLSPVHRNFLRNLDRAGESCIAVRTATEVALNALDPEKPFGGKR